MPDQSAGAPLVVVNGWPAMIWFIFGRVYKESLRDAIRCALTSAGVPTVAVLLVACLFALRVTPPDYGPTLRGDPLGAALVLIGGMPNRLTQGLLAWQILIVGPSFLEPLWGSGRLLVPYPQPGIIHRT